MRRFDLDLELFSIDLTHSLDFSKGHSITIIKSMLLFFMKAYKTSFFLSDSSNMNRFALFSSGINNSVLVSKVNKTESIKTKIASIDESMIFLVDRLSQFDNVVLIIVIKYNYTFVITNSTSV